MNKMAAMMLSAAMLASPLATGAAMADPPSWAPAHGYRAHNAYQWHGDRDGDWDAAHAYRRGHYRARRLTREDRIYRGSDGRYYCRRSDGTTGLVIGAIGGGLLGNALGGNTLGTLLGAGGGALLGRSIDRGRITCR